MRLVRFTEMSGTEVLVNLDLVARAIRYPASPQGLHPEYVTIFTADGEQINVAMAFEDVINLLQGHG